MPMGLRLILAILTFLAGGFLILFLVILFGDRIGWNHKPTSEEMSEVKRLRTEMNALRKQGAIEGASGRKNEISDRKTNGTDPVYQRRSFAVSVAIISLFITVFLFGFPFGIFTLKLWNSLKLAFLYFGFPFLLGSVFMYFKVFCEQGKEEGAVKYALGVYYGTAVLKLILSRFTEGNSLLLYGISAVVAVAACIVIWQRKKKKKA